MLISAVSDLLALLEKQEENSNGNLFHPTTISSCRTMDIIELERILTIMKSEVNKSTPLMNTMHLVLGDWSNDGHGKYEKVICRANKTIDEVRDAYKASCKLMGFSFNHNNDYTEVKRSYTIASKYQVCTEYENNTISTKVVNLLIQFECPLVDQIKEAHRYLDVELFTDLWWWFVGVSLPGLIYEKVEGDVPVINGFWNNSLNCQFGYGLYN